MYVWVRLKHVYKPFPHVFFSVLSRLSDSDSLLLLNYLLPVSSSTAPNVCTTTLGNSVTLYEGTAPCQHRHIDKYKKCARLYWDLLPRILGPLDPGFLLILLTILVSAIKIGARLNGSSINIFEAAPPAGKGRKRSRISWSWSLHFQDFVCVCVTVYIMFKLASAFSFLICLFFRSFFAQVHTAQLRALMLNGQLVSYTIAHWRKWEPQRWGSIDRVTVIDLSLKSIHLSHGSFSCESFWIDESRKNVSVTSFQLSAFPLSHNTDAQRHTFTTNIFLVSQGSKREPPKCWPIPGKPQFCR
jgi:hypothetical protein